MTTTIYGSSSTFSVGNASTPEAIVPANGEPVDAVPPGATIQTVLDYIATLGQDVYDTKAFGVSRIRTVISIAALKDIAAPADGDLVLLLDPNYVGGGSTLLSGFGLFVFSLGATWAQTSLPNITDAWIVVSPDDNTGRWLNISAGVGWNIGPDPSFQPRPAQRSQLWSNTGTINNTVDYTGLALTNIGTEIELGTGLPMNATIHLDFDFSLNSPTMGTSGVVAMVEVSKGGAPFTLVPGARKPLGDGGGSGVNTEFMSVHLGAVYTAPDNDTYDFRVSLLGAAAQTMTIYRMWTARGLSYLAT